MGLTQEQVRELLAGSKSNGKQGPTTTAKFLALNAEGKAEWQAGKPYNSDGQLDFGVFVGKVGSVRRSRRGVSTRVPNGSRKFIPSETVLAYKL